MKKFYLFISILVLFTSTAIAKKNVFIVSKVNDQIVTNLDIEKEASYLKILNPQRGEKRELVEMCRKNADLHLREVIAKKVKRKEVISKTIESLQADLDIETEELLALFLSHHNCF